LTGRHGIEENPPRNYHSWRGGWFGGEKRGWAGPSFGPSCLKSPSWILICMGQIIGPRQQKQRRSIKEIKSRAKNQKWDTCLKLLRSSQITVLKFHKRGVKPTTAIGYRLSPWVLKKNKTKIPNKGGHKHHECQKLPPCKEVNKHRGGQMGNHKIPPLQPGVKPGQLK